MAHHVDVVETRWSAGAEERVARVSLVDGEIEIQADDHWRRLIENVIHGEDDGERALELLVEQFHSDYAHAIEPHDDDACPFAHESTAPFHETPAREAVA